MLNFCAGSLSICVSICLQMINEFYWKWFNLKMKNKCMHYEEVLLSDQYKEGFKIISFVFKIFFSFSSETLRN